MKRSGVLVAILLACSCREPVAPDATVYFELDAPLCSSVIPVEFSIDGVRAGADTFVTVSAIEHTKSRAFPLPAGSHTLGARTDFGYVWPDTTVNLAAGEVFTASLPFYCS